MFKYVLCCIPVFFYIRGTTELYIAVCAGNATREFTEEGVRLGGAAVLAAVLEHLVTTTDITHARELVIYGEKSEY